MYLRAHATSCLSSKICTKHGSLRFTVFVLSTDDDSYACTYCVYCVCFFCSNVSGGNQKHERDWFSNRHGLILSFEDAAGRHYQVNKEGVRCES